jgi:hypothetical protein
MRPSAANAAAISAANSGGGDVVGMFFSPYTA